MRISGHPSFTNIASAQLQVCSRGTSSVDVDMSPRCSSSSTNVYASDQDVPSSKSDFIRLYEMTWDLEKVKVLPYHEFYSFTTEEAISRTLRSARARATSIHDLVQLIRNPDADKSIKRIYLTLLRINKLSELDAVLSTGFSDIHLPLVKRQVVSSTFAFQSQEQPSAPEPRHFFSRWPTNDMEQFIRHQSLFLAPVPEPDFLQYPSAPVDPLPILTNVLHKKTARGLTSDCSVPIPRSRFEFAKVGKRPGRHRSHFFD